MSFTRIDYEMVMHRKTSAPLIEAMVLLPSDLINDAMRKRLRTEIALAIHRAVGNQDVACVAIKSAKLTPVAD